MHVGDVALERRLAGQQAVEGRAQAVDVRPRAQALEVALGLLGAHVGRRPQRRCRAASRRLPLAELGTSVRSPESDPGSTRPSGLASPQSTTSVSPCLPTMMLPGLMSRCSTPRLCA